MKIHRDYLPKGDKHALRCPICGRELKTYSALEEVYDFEEGGMHEEIKYYAEDAVLDRNYICKSCYRNLAEALKKRYIRACKKFVGDTDNRVQEIRDKMNSKINEELGRSSEVKYIMDKLSKTVYLSDLDKEFLKTMRKYDNVVYNLSLMESAMNQEKRNRAKEERIPLREWAKKYDFTLSEVGVSRQNDIFTLLEFYKETESSRCFIVNVHDWKEKRDKVWRDVAKTLHPSVAAIAQMV